MAPFAEQLLNVSRAFLGRCLLAWFAVCDELTVDYALAISHHPNLLPAVAKEHDAGCQPLFGMFFEALDADAAFCIDIIYAGGYLMAEVAAADVGLHRADEFGDEKHGIAAVAHVRVDAAGRLAGASIYHRDEVIGAYDSVFARLRAGLSLFLLLYYAHF